uniref:(northern house mosquito) hypothetical protein n=1 Tax=Culex pipiens TaxID=7175 RepID=A0A8D8G898_CULPI
MRGFSISLFLCPFFSQDHLQSVGRAQVLSADSVPAQADRSPEALPDGLSVQPAAEAEEGPVASGGDSAPGHQGQPHGAGAAVVQQLLQDSRQLHDDDRGRPRAESDQRHQTAKVPVYRGSLFDRLREIRAGKWRDRAAEKEQSALLAKAAVRIAHSAGNSAAHRLIRR